MTCAVRAETTRVSCKGAKGSTVTIQPCNLVQQGLQPSQAICKVIHPFMALSAARQHWPLRRQHSHGSPGGCQEMISLGCNNIDLLGKHHLLT